MIIDDYEARIFTGSSGDTRPYRLFIPPEYSGGKKYPLVLFHHGGGGRGNENLANLEGPCPLEWADAEHQARHPCFIVAPQIPRHAERDVQSARGGRPPRTGVMQVHIQTIHEILDRLENEFSIDTRREYVTGLSMGGECTWMSLIERPDRFAAAVPICAGDKIISLSPAELGQQFSRFPLWIFHGDDDPVISVEVSRKLVKALRDAGGEPRYTEYPGVNHASWLLAYRDPDLIEWLFTQSAPPTSSAGSHESSV